MPDLIRLALEKGKNVEKFTIKDYWLDMGRKDDYEKAIEYVNSKKL